MCRGRAKSATGCRCARQVRGFIQPRLLLLLAKQAAHGYELMEALRALEGEEHLADPGMLYRPLRQFEAAGLVSSTWDEAGRGPARRVYRLTEAGRDYLAWWSTDIRQTRARLDRFLVEYELVQANGLAVHPKSSRR